VVDTHAHLGMCEQPEGELVAAARKVGVRRVLTVGIDEASNREAIAAADAHQGVFAAIGRHPGSATGFDDAAAAEIERLAAHERVRAIGETGLDYYRDRASREDQLRAFEAQIEIATRTGLPLVIHMRDPPPEELAAAGRPGAVTEAFELLAAEATEATVVLHCFSAAPERVPEAAERGWYCSFAGNVTYPKAEGLREAARLVPLELLLVETDSPYLAPQPVRGRPNQPANVLATAERVAEVRGMELAELDQAVEANSARVFGW
jgi:TatD DNase family protein